jgi:hypothetical protein
MGKNHAI